MSTCMYPRLFNLSRFICISLYIYSYISPVISISNYLSLALSSLVSSILTVIQFFFWPCLSKFLLLPIRRATSHTEEHILPRPILSIVAGMLPWLIVSLPFLSLPCVILLFFTSSHPISVSLTVDFLVSPFLILSDLKLSYPGLNPILSDLIVFPFTLAGLYSPKTLPPTVHCIGMPPE